MASLTSRIRCSVYRSASVFGACSGSPVVDDGEVDDGEVDDGEVDDGEVDDGEVDDGEVEDGAPDADGAREDIEAPASDAGGDWVPEAESIRVSILRSRVSVRSTTSAARLLSPDSPGTPPSLRPEPVRT
jgi:hypothetical protein